jgi:hypothetical protein
MYSSRQAGRMGSVSSFCEAREIILPSPKTIVKMFLILEKEINFVEKINQKC